jgi:hypothetical protein
MSLIYLKDLKLGLDPKLSRINSLGQQINWHLMHRGRMHKGRRCAKSCRDFLPTCLPFHSMIKCLPPEENSMKHTPARRKFSKLPDVTRKKLEMYSLAAAAAGMSIAALSPAAQAEVVFTPAHQKIFDRGVILDLNHDGLADFEILQREFFADGAGVIIYSHAGNRAFGAASRANFLSMLPKGYTVGPNSSRFQRGSTSTNDPIPHKFLYYCEANSGGRSCTGAWDNGTDGSYVGFKFYIDGEVHYGWARLAVTVQQPNNPKSVHLTGYAYETVANKPIVTGRTSGAAETSVRESGSSANDKRTPATLGRLAAGASNVADKTIR